MATDLEGLVRYLITSLVDDADAVTVTRRESGNDVIYDVAVASEDTGKVIGRQGRIIKAIRTVVKAAAAVDGSQVSVEILD